MCQKMSLFFVSFVFFHSYTAHASGSIEKEIEESIGIFNFTSNDIHQHDVKQFIKKIRQNTYEVFNETTEELTVYLSGQNIRGDKHKEYLVLKAGETGKVAHENPYLEISIDNNPPNVFVNIDLKDELYSIFLSSTLRDIEKYIIPDIDCFDFGAPYIYEKKYISKEIEKKKEQICPNHPIYKIEIDEITFDEPEKVLNHKALSSSHPLYPEKKIIVPEDQIISKNILEIDSKEEKFAKQYTGNFLYISNYQMKMENINFRAFMDTVDKKFRILNPKILFKQPIDKKMKGIPEIIHTIWLTHPEKPRELSDHYIDWLVKSEEAAGRDTIHYLWVLGKKKLLSTQSALLKTNVIIREVRELGEFKLREIFIEEVKKKRFGRASDILRLILLKKFGGVYKDTDVLIHHSLKKFFKYYDFVICKEPMSYWCGNAFIMAEPHHPFINKALELIERNYLNPPFYIGNGKDHDGFKTIIVTGPGLLTAAIASEFGKTGLRDIVLPPAPFYPLRNDSTTGLDVMKPNLPAPSNAYAQHDWDTSWVGGDDKFGSVG